jgi:hypothetical protein
MKVQADARTRVDLVDDPNCPPSTPKKFTNVVINPENALSSPAENKLVNNHSGSSFLRRQSQQIAIPLMRQHV